MTSELPTARRPSCAAALWAVSVTARQYVLEHPRFELRLRLRRDHQEHVPVVERGVVLREVRDRVCELRVRDVVAAPPRDAGIVEPHAGLVVADDRDEVRHGPSGLLVVAVVAR